MAARAARRRARSKRSRATATTTRRPARVRVAFHSCSRTATAGSCALLSTAQWARLDPGNGDPWPSRSSEAATRDDRAGLTRRCTASAALPDRRSPHAVAGAIAAEAAPTDRGSDWQRGTGDQRSGSRRVASARGAAPASACRVRRTRATRTARQACDAAATSSPNDPTRFFWRWSGPPSAGDSAGPSSASSPSAACRSRSRAVGRPFADVRRRSTSRTAATACVAPLARSAAGPPSATVQAARDWMVASGKGFEAFAPARAKQRAASRAAAVEESSARVAGSGACARPLRQLSRYCAAPPRAR